MKKGVDQMKRKHRLMENEGWNEVWSEERRDMFKRTMERRWKMARRKMTGAKWVAEYFRWQTQDGERYFCFKFNMKDSDAKLRP